MFKAVPLVLVNIQVAQEEISRATAVLTRLRIMHLINLVETPLGKLGYMGELERDLLNRYQQVGDEVDRWTQALEIFPQVVEIPADLERVVLRCLAKKPADRFQTAVDLREALAACEAASRWNRDGTRQGRGEIRRSDRYSRVGRSLRRYGF